MQREQSNSFLSAVFVDYDNIYLSLKRKSDDAAKHFAKNAMIWLKQIEAGTLITPTNGHAPQGKRRIVMNRCYGNPVPRRNPSDNSTDMSSFPFVRHHFLRAGFEVVDCPPLTANLKNSSDIRMVMDLRDYLDADTHFDEFIILSGDADFTPVLHRLRARARRTVIYATDYTAVPYTAISDGEVREADLIALLNSGARMEAERPAAAIAATPSGPPSAAETRLAIISEVVAAVRTANAPVPLEVLADRAVRVVGHDRTIGTGWAGAGGFRELLIQELPAGLRLSGEPPYVVIDTQRHIAQSPAPQRLQSHPVPSAPKQTERPLERVSAPPAHTDRDVGADADAFAGLGRLRKAHSARSEADLPDYQPTTATVSTRSAPQPTPAAKPAMRQPAADPQAKAPDASNSIQQSIARIHLACKAPPLAPPEYRLLFELCAQEINENGLIGAQTIQNIAKRAQDRGIEIHRDDVRFVLEVVSEADPWFEQGASATLFAGRFRNFVVARCRAQGLTLSADELDLVEAWFAGSGLPTASVRATPPAPSFAPSPPARPAQPQADTAYWSNAEDSHQTIADERARGAPATAEAGDLGNEDFPRIVRTRLRG